MNVGSSERHPSLPRSVVCVLAVGAVFAASSLAQAGWTTTILSGRRADGVSSGGQTVGWAQTAGSVNYAARWNSNGAEEQLDRTGMSASFGRGVNQSGHSVGIAMYTGGSEFFATRWNSAGNATQLGRTSTTISSYAHSINNAGIAVGGASYSGGGGQFAARWDASGNLTQLHRAALMIASNAYGVNDSGQIVGDANYQGTGGGTFATRWTTNSDGTTTSSRLGTAGMLGSYAQAVNSSGQVAGHAEYTTLTGALFATRWDSLGNATQLARTGMSRSRGNGVNDNGQVVGYGEFGTGRRAVLWGANPDELVDLHVLLDPSLAFTRTEALSTWSDAGHTYVAGFGLRDGFGSRSFAILWTFTNQVQAVPLPTSTGLAALGLGLIAMRRRRAGT